MFLSIIIPHYNLPQALLKRCIDSIMATELPTDCYEIIVVDDGSDTPPMWINEIYSTSNIKLITGEHHCQGAARNTGISIAQGTYIQFIDADDTLQCNNAMEQCIAILQRENPDILRFSYRVCKGQSTDKKKKLQKIKYGNTISGAVYMEQNNLPATVFCYFVKTELLRKKNILFTPDIYHEDEEFSTKLHYHAKTLIESNAPIYNYCIRENSTITAKSAKMREKRLCDRITVLEKLVKFKKETDKQNNNVQKKALQRKLTTLAVDAIINYIYAGKSAKETYAMCQDRLAPLALYPIEGDYGIKFNIFKKLANNTTGITILRHIIPTKR